jgi:hypothetical protein
MFRVDLGNERNEELEMDDPELLRVYNLTCKDEKIAYRKDPTTAESFRLPSILRKRKIACRVAASGSG